LLNIEQWCSLTMPGNTVTKVPVDDRQLPRARTPARQLHPATEAAIDPVIVRHATIGAMHRTTRPNDAFDPDETRTDRHLGVRAFVQSFVM